MRMKMLVISAAVLVVGTLAACADAQDVIGGTANQLLEPRQLTRGQLWLSYFNTGASGYRHPEQATGNLFADLNYPGTYIPGGDDFQEHFGARSFLYDQIDIQTLQARGHGWYTAVKVDGQESVSYASSLVKAKEESDDVLMMTVDPTVDFGGRFASVGNDVINPRSSRSMGTWWPGTGVVNDAKKPVEILNYRSGQYNSAATDNFPENIILSKWTTKTGITGHKAAYAWNHPEYDDFIIEEWIWENTGDTDGDRVADLPGGGHDLQNVYFGLHNRFTTSSSGYRGSHTAWYWDWGPLDSCFSRFQPNADNGQDDKIKYTESPNYDGPASAVGLKLTYQYDWNNFCLTGSLADDVGDPWRSVLKAATRPVPDFTDDGDLLGIAYVGVADIDTDPTDGFIGDNEVYIAPDVAQQPFAHNFFHHVHRQQDGNTRSDLVTDEPNPFEMSDAVMYQLITRSPPLSYFEPFTSHDAALARPTRASGDENLGVPLLPLPDDPTEPMPVGPIPEWEWVNRHGIAAAYSVIDTYGPYDMAPGDKVKLVIAYVAGAPVEHSFRTYRRQQDNSELKKEEGGAAFTNLIKHLNKAKEAYALGFDLPNQPPDVNATLQSSENARSELVWSNDADGAINPDTGQPDVAGYRVYRSETLPDMWVQFADVKVGTASSGTYRVEDPESVSGFQYLYQVRSYQGSANSGFVSRVTGATVAGGVSAYESGPGDPSTFYYPDGGVNGLSPVQVASADADRMEKQVAVVPNPYIDDGIHSYEGTVKLRIINLPRRAKLRIYSMAGDLVGALDHESDTVGERSYYQLNRLITNEIQFGTYILVVESLMPESLGQTQFTKFVIIR
jgi:hypothetical protein